MASSLLNLKLDESLFRDLWPFIQDDDVTDIRWNGRQLWIENLKTGRNLSDIKLTPEFLNIFTQKIATAQNVNFNRSTGSLQASTDELRIHCIHPSHTGDHTYSLAIRKIPAVARITDKSVLEQGYADKFFVALLGALVRARCKGIVIGDVGAGKTELLKYVAHFLPDNMSTMTVEDTLEMKLPVIYPKKDITSVLIDDSYTAEKAIRDALRLETKYLWMAEARGREIARIMESASTGCTCWTTIHCADTWTIPDRIVQMAGDNVDKEAFENDVFTFFDVGIKVKKVVTDDGIVRRIDQICFFDRTDKVNHTTIFFRNGQYTGRALPKSLINIFKEAGETQILEMAQKLPKPEKEPKEVGPRPAYEGVKKKIESNSQNVNAEKNVAKNWNARSSVE